MAANPRWQFASTQGGREDDVSNPLIEMFEGDYNYFLAREILQNALDARDPKSNKPAEVIFALSHFTSAEIPGLAEFREILAGAKKFWPKEKVKCHSFLDSATKCIDQKRIPVLKVSDFNTTGLAGTDNDRNGPWYGLIKSVGSTTKHTGEGGSFGLGKGAPFAASYLRMIFYSTKTLDSKVAFQGVSEIVSHADSQGDVKRGSGSYGDNNQSAIRTEKGIPLHMLRRSIGLDLYVVGYKLEEEWESKLTDSILRNFWPAIVHNELVVRVEDQEINSGNLESILKERFENRPPKEGRKPEGNPWLYFQAYRTPDRVFSVLLKNLGEVSLSFKRTSSHLNRVAMCRKSKMVIYTGEFRFAADYAAVFTCFNDKGNAELRRMEAPEHNKWEPDRYKDKGAEIEYELKSFIRESLKSMAQIQKSGIVEIPDLEKYLPFSGDEVEGSQSGTQKRTDKESSLESAREIGKEEEGAKDVRNDPFDVPVIKHDSWGPGLDSRRKKEPKRRNKTKGRRGGSEGLGQGIKPAKISVRTFLQMKQKDKLQYAVIIRSEEKGTYDIPFAAGGEEGTEEVELVEARDEKGQTVRISGTKLIGVAVDPSKPRKFTLFIRTNIPIALEANPYV